MLHFNESYVYTFFLLSRDNYWNYFRRLHFFLFYIYFFFVNLKAVHLYLKLLIKTTFFPFFQAFLPHFIVAFFCCKLYFEEEPFFFCRLSTAKLFLTRYDGALFPPPNSFYTLTIFFFSPVSFILSLYKRYHIF